MFLAPIRVIKVNLPGSSSGFKVSIRAKASAGEVFGPIFTPIGFRIFFAKSICAPSSCLVRSPIQRKWAETSYGWSDLESMRVSAFSYSRIKASCDE